MTVCEAQQHIWDFVISFQFATGAAAMWVVMICLEFREIDKKYSPSRKPPRK